MAKRFTDTDLWKSQRWFRKLNPEYKLAFCYIKDQCNHAGLWKLDCSDLIEDLGFEGFELNKFIVSVNTEFDKVTGKKITKERIRMVKNSFLWITGFVQFQYEGKDKCINQSAAPVRTALLFLQSVGVLEDAINKGYITLREPLSEGWQTPKDKDKDKDKDILKGGMGENKKYKGIKFDKSCENVFFEDGSSQPLGQYQLSRVREGNYQPHYIKKGKIE